jgi:iodotyrosine deiodinase
MADAYRPVPLTTFRRLPVSEMRERAGAFNALLQKRRTVRFFSPDPVPRDIIEECIRTAGAAPSGANQQPWQFVAVSDSQLKHRIREGAQTEEREFYERRATTEWLDALAPLGTDSEKPFLTTAPWLIAVFYKAYEVGADGGRVKQYYPIDSTGIATGFLLAALHNAGLASLTHTPSPMAFLNEILERPANERPFVLVVTGYPAADATVPDLARKPLSAIATFR